MTLETRAAEIAKVTPESADEIVLLLRRVRDHVEDDPAADVLVRNAIDLACRSGLLPGDVVVLMLLRARAEILPPMAPELAEAMARWEADQLRILVDETDRMMGFSG